jgi:AI-2 transport protein TqsA
MAGAMPKGGIPANVGPSLREIIESSNSRKAFKAWDEPEEIVDETHLTHEEKLERRRQRAIARAERAEERRAQMREALTTISLLIIGIYALGVMLIELSFILVPLVFSRFLVFIFAPLIKVLSVRRGRDGQETGIPRWAAVLVCLLVIFVCLAILMVIIGLTINSIVSDASSYVDDFNHAFRGIFQFAEKFGYTKEEIYEMLPHINMGELAIEILRYLYELIPQIILVLLIVVYMLLDIEITLDQKKSRLEEMIDEQIRSYIVIHGIISIIVAVGTAAILFLFSIDLVLFFGLMTFVLNFIPNVGSVVATLLPLPFVILNPDFAIWKFFAVGFCLTALHFVVGQVIEPQLLGDHMEVPPITVIICLLFWASVWGIVGAIVSVPLTTSIKVYLENIDHPATQALAGMIVGNFGFFDTTKHEHEEDFTDSEDEDYFADHAEEKIPILSTSSAKH